MAKLQTTTENLELFEKKKLHFKLQLQFLSGKKMLLDFSQIDQP